MNQYVNKIYVDGRGYESEEQIWDLGSFSCVSVEGLIRHYDGLSKDAPDKLPHYVATGSSALCLDTGDYYKFHAKSDTWYKL